MAGLALKLNAFEGPLDLLLHLIEKDKVDIYDIPIVEITQQYLAYLKELDNFDMELASDFLVMAATLLQIKSRMLLPDDKEIDEEEEDPRQRLVEMLVEYRRIKKCASALLEKKINSEKMVYRKPMFGDLLNIYLEPCRPEELLQALSMMTEDKSLQSAYVEPQAYSVQEKMSQILDYLATRPQGFTLNELLTTGSPGEKVATFLGVLELLKMNAVGIAQSQRFAPIFIFAKNTNMING